MKNWNLVLVSITSKKTFGTCVIIPRALVKD